MIARILMLICVFGLAAGNVQAGFWSNVKQTFFGTQHRHTPTIDVLVVNDKPGVMLEIKGKYRLIDPNTGEFMSKRFMGKKKYFQSIAAGLKWGEEFPGTFQLQIVPEDLNSGFIIDDVEYRGSLFVYDIGGSISIVNRVTIEDYLSSILPGQYDENFSQETSAAIAICARTKALWQSKNRQNNFWAVDGRKENYRGVESMDSASQMQSAITATQKMVLSKTGSYEGVITPFAAAWVGVDQGVASTITLFEAEEMSLSGKHAAQILSKAFPFAHIELVR